MAEQPRTTEELLSARASYKGQLTQFKKLIERKDTSKLNAELIALKLKRLERTIEGYDDVQTQLEKADPSQISHRDTFDEAVSQAIHNANRLMAQLRARDEPAHLLQTISNQDNEQQTTIPARFTLPKIDLPRFSGRREEWKHFSELFTSLIDSNDALPTIQKHHYLRAYLVGPAASLLESVTVTAENYSTSLELLKKRYHPPKDDMKRHLDGLIDLPFMKNENASALQTLHDTVGKHVRSIRALSADAKYWDAIIIHLTVRKLDSRTASAWEEFSGNTDNPSFEQFSEFMMRRIDIVEAGHKSTEIKSCFLKPKSSVLNKSRQFSKVFSAVGQSMEDNPSADSKDSSCELCEEFHPLYFCRSFKGMSVDDRRKHIQRFKRCFNCLSRKHLISQCKSTRKCSQCQTRHHTMLHRSSTVMGKHLRPNSATRKVVEKRPTVYESTTDHRSSTKPQAHHQQVAEERRETVQSLNHNASTHRGYQVLLSTAKVLVQNQRGEWIPVRCLLDSAATHDFATDSLISQLELPATKTEVKVTGIDQKSTEALSFAKIVIKDSAYGTFSTHLNCLLIQHIGSDIPSVTFSTENWKIPSDLKLADPDFNKQGKVDLLLSAESFWNVFLGGKVAIHPGVFARNTKLGWILTGRFHAKHSNEKASCYFSRDSLNEKLERLWQIESEPTVQTREMTPEEKMCEEIYLKTTTRQSDGRFIVTMPRISNPPVIQNTKSLAIRRLHSAETRFKVEPLVKEQYKQFMEEYEALDHMEVISRDDHSQGEEIVYLTHHPVWKNPTTKDQIRVVFNGSAPDSQGITLNDTLLNGPCVQPELFSTIMNFRLHAIAVTADIEKMYRQVFIHSSQQNLQRIVWRSEEGEAIRSFKLKTLTYGLKPSSFLSTRTLIELANRDGHLVSNLAAEAVRKNFYVDDYLQSFKTVEEAVETTTQVKELLKRGCFPLTKFCSNSKLFMEEVEPECRALEPLELFKDETTVKTLGLKWKPLGDSISYSFNEEEKDSRTKRQILSEIAKIFDPLHLISPVVVKSKMYMQELWKLKIDWDEEVDCVFLEQWRKYKTTLASIDKIKIPRKLCGSTRLNQPCLHIFCDASERAYGCTAYLVNEEEGKIESSLICAKSKVAPVKKVSLPRLELCSAVLAAELKGKLTSILQVDIKSTYLWTDSTIVLSWISQPAATWQTFVANRVQKIHDATETTQWKHVLTESNPADVVSRGCTPEELAVHTLYWKGPEWLTLQPKYWPSTLTPTDDAPEKKKVSSILIASSDDLPIWEKFSSFSRLVRVVGWILRWKSIVVDKENLSSDCLTLEEIERARIKVIKLVQMSAFKKDYATLTKKQVLEKSCRLRSLNPFIDMNGILRVGGRLAKSELTFDAKHPIILPYRHHLTKLIIRKFHVENLHVEPRTLLYLLRQEYWPINGVKAVTGVTRKCITCFKGNPEKTKQLMGALPECRTTPQTPFTSTGIDYAGPFLLKGTKEPTKAWIVLFVCMTVGAVHIELVSRLTTSYFVAALKRFIARRGRPSEIYSDHGINFLGLLGIRAGADSSKFKQAILKFAEVHKIKWNFIPPYSPSMGGRWEAQIKVFKRLVKSALGNNMLNYEQCNSLIIQAEGIMNSRPISQLSSDPKDLLPLTPNHFLIGKTIQVTSSALVKKGRPASEVVLVQTLTNNLWKRWKTEYLNTLQQRGKWKDSVPNLKIGDLVLLKMPSQPFVWKLGRIVNIYFGKDQKARVAYVKTAKGMITRHISSLAPLPLSISSEAPVCSRT